MRIIDKLLGRDTGPALPSPVGQRSPSASYMRGNRGSIFSGWKPVRRSEQRDRAIAWDDAVARTADSLHNSGWLSGAVEQCIANTVGAEGLRLRPAPEHDEFGMDSGAARSWSRAVGRRFDLFASSKDECDMSGMRTLAQIQAAAFGSWLATGEVLAEIAYKRRPWGTWGTKVRLMHPSRLLRRSDPTRRIINGVQIDGDGMPIAYLTRRANPGQIGEFEEVLVPARDRFGRPRVIHIFNGPPETYRGITPLAPALQVLRQFDQLSDATLSTAIIKAVFAAVFTSDGHTDEAIEGLLTDQERSEMRRDGQAPIDAYVDMVADFYEGSSIDASLAGRVVHAFPGQKLEFLANQFPGSDYKDFSADLKREFARCLGMLYESATGDYQGATYASLGRGMAEIYEVTKTRRADVLAPLIRAIYEAWLEEEIEAGNVPFPGGVSAFLARRAAACRAILAGSARPVAEELKLARAHDVWIKAGVMSLTHVCRELGIDYEHTGTELAAEEAYRREFGVPDPVGPSPSSDDQPPDPTMMTRSPAMAKETACQRLDRLREARDRIILGEHETEVEHEGGNGSKARARYGKPDLPKLERLIFEAERDCARERGLAPPSQRRPIIGVRTGSTTRRVP